MQATTSWKSGLMSFPKVALAMIFFSVVFFRTHPLSFLSVCNSALSSCTLPLWNNFASLPVSAIAVASTYVLSCCCVGEIAVDKGSPSPRLGLCESALPSFTLQPAEQEDCSPGCKCCAEAYVELPMNDRWPLCGPLTTGARGGDGEQRRKKVGSHRQRQCPLRVQHGSLACLDKGGRRGQAGK